MIHKLLNKHQIGKSIISTIHGFMYENRHPNLLNQKEMFHRLINQEEEFYILVLDAARYDYFKEIYNEYLEGDLKKCKSSGSHTLQFLKNTFPDYYNLTLFSGTPNLNSFGSLKFRDYAAKNHFKKIINVWKFGWDEEMGTTPPEALNETLKQYKRNKKINRALLWYSQPHIPYIGETKLSIPLPSTRKQDNLETQCNRVNKYGDTIKEGKIEDETLRVAYKDNLRLVLDKISNLIPRLSEKIIITSDHGNLLGEYNLYLHPELNLPELRIVPWLEINK